MYSNSRRFSESVARIVVRYFLKSLEQATISCGASSSSIIQCEADPGGTISVYFCPYRQCVRAINSNVFLRYRNLRECASTSIKFSANTEPRLPAGLAAELSKDTDPEMVPNVQRIDVRPLKLLLALSECPQE